MIKKRQVSIALLSVCFLSPSGFCAEEGGGAGGGRSSPVGGMYTGSREEFEDVWAKAEAQVAAWKGRPPQPLSPAEAGIGSGPMTAAAHARAMRQVQDLMHLSVGGPAAALRDKGREASPSSSFFKSSLPEDEITKKRLEELLLGETVPHSTYSLNLIIKDMEEDEWISTMRRFRELGIKCIAEQDYIFIFSNIRSISEADWPTHRERVKTMYARRR